MIKINKDLLKRLLAIADAYDYLYEYEDVIGCLKNDNGLDDDTVQDFLDETSKLTNKIIEEEQEIDDWFGNETRK